MALGFALTQPAGGQEVVQSLPPPAAAELSEALRQLAQDPRSVAALVAAGRASLALGDEEAGFGFLARAQALAPDDGGVLAGLGLVALRRGETLSAVQLFDQAEAAGYPMAGLASERGLAHDLIGDSARAQRHYRSALVLGEDAEVRRRLAISHAIAGDAAAAEEVLLPLLQRGDRAAFRARAFALAILGREEEAITIAQAMLPPTLALRLEPYLRAMPRLTRAQQAAAANLGRFPASLATQAQEAEPALDRGGDATPPARLARRGADSRLIPEGQPLGLASRAQGSTITLLPSTEAEPAPEAAEALPVAVAAAAPDGAGATPAGQGSASASAGRPEGSSGQGEAQLPDLASAFADLRLEPGARVPVVAAPEAVDITTIEPARERRERVAAPAQPPAHPSRHWVQVATGRDLAAFGFDWRRLQRQGGAVLAQATPHHARWGATNRLLIGPFASVAEANAMVRSLSEVGINAFRFTSGEGEEVSRLRQNGS